jgi:hypothetical protein
MLRVNAGTPEEQKLANSGPVSGTNDVVLHLNVLEQEFHGQIIIRLDAPHPGGREDNNGRPLFLEKTFDSRLDHEIELRAIARHQVRKAVLLQLAQQRTPDETPMTGNEYFVRFLHKRSDDCGLPFSFLLKCAIHFVRPRGAEGAKRPIGDVWRRTKAQSSIVPDETIALKAPN